jgi:hypothetical protein
MIDSSDELASGFDGVDVKSAHRLLSVIGQASDGLAQQIERTYLEHAREFTTVLQFAKAIGWVKEHGTYLELTEQGRTTWKGSTDERSIRRALLEAITGKLSPYRQRVAGYLARYSLSRSELTYRPSVEERLRERPVRDFLMDLRVVAHRRSDDSYVLMAGSEELFIWARNIAQPITKARVTALQARQDSLGRAAEVAVLAYERTRLGQSWWPQIEHLSQDLPFASYDIKSVTVTEGCGSARFIEVKAVPDDSFRFYWSRAELETAQLLADRYFLYLLPVSSGNFLLDRMLIVQDPYKAIYRNESDWGTEEDVVVCSKR